MIYVDTSVLVALCVEEPKSAVIRRWYASRDTELVSAIWCVTEFASALGIKQRTGQIDAIRAQTAWEYFERLCASDLQLLAVEPDTFHHAAILTLDANTGLRSGDSLHLAAILESKAKHIATLDSVLAANARKMKVKVVEF